METERIFIGPLVNTEKITPGVLPDHTRLAGELELMGILGMDLPGPTERNIGIIIKQMRKWRDALEFKRCLIKPRQRLMRY